MNNLNFESPEVVGRDDRREVIDGGGSSGQSAAVDLERYWHEAIGLKYWLAGIVALGLLLGILVTLLATPLYQANARLEVSRVTADVTNLDALEVESQVSELQYLNTQYKLLVSDFMAKRVIESGNLTRDEDFREAFAIGDAANINATIEEILFADEVGGE